MSDLAKRVVQWIAGLAISRVQGSAERQVKLDEDLKALGTVKGQLVTELGAQTAAVTNGQPVNATALSKLYYQFINDTDDYCRRVLRLRFSQQEVRDSIEDVVGILEYQPTVFRALVGLTARAKGVPPTETPGQTLSRADRLLSEYGTVEERDRVNRARFQGSTLPLLAKGYKQGRRWWELPLSGTAAVLAALAVLWIVAWLAVVAFQARAVEAVEGQLDNAATRHAGASVPEPCRSPDVFELLVSRAVWVPNLRDRESCMAAVYHGCQVLQGATGSPPGNETNCDRADLTVRRACK